MGIEEVVVTITKDGSVQVATNGFTGLSCTSATAGLERMLGNEVLERTMTDEAFLEQGVLESLGEFSDTRPQDIWPVVGQPMHETIAIRGPRVCVIDAK